MGPLDPKNPDKVPTSVICGFIKPNRTGIRARRVKLVIVDDLDSVRVDPAMAGRAGGPPLPPWLRSPSDLGTPGPDPAETGRVSLGVTFINAKARAGGPSIPPPTAGKPNHPG